MGEVSKKSHIFWENNPILNNIKWITTRVARAKEARSYVKGCTLYKNIFLVPVHPRLKYYKSYTI